MSRTYKDRPRYVRELEDVRKGKINHDHSSQWRDEDRQYERSLYHNKKNVVDGVHLNNRHYMEHEGHLLRAYRDFLNERGILFREFREKRACYKDSPIEFIEISRWTVSSLVRYVEVTVIEPYEIVKSRYQSLSAYACTEAEHLSWRPNRTYYDWIDTRDGKPARCTPKFRAYYPSPKAKRRASAKARARTNQFAHEAVKEARAESLDEGFDKVGLYELEMTRRNCWCC